VKQRSPHDLQIRRAVPSDLPAVLGCVARAYAPYVARIGRMPASMLQSFESELQRGELHVAELGSAAPQFVGSMVLVVVDDRALEVRSLAIEPAFQRRGFGRRLLSRAQEQAVQLGLQQLRLYTNEALTELLAYYAALGFREQSRREEHGLRRVHMTKLV
jgi:ribosomal protein S18 acetylase RimI-like enzyme